MAQVINTNIASLTAQRNLNSSQSSLQTSLQRLSSGLRINSAKDDAAGLAISERMTSQIRGMDVAMRNANDGISLAQTAEGAMVEIGNNLQRIRELAVQSANATNNADDRKALNAEVEQLVAEIDRVANQTSFNGTKLLNGDFTGALFQVGADAGQVIGVDGIVDANKDALGDVALAEVKELTIIGGTDSDVTMNDLEINSVSVSGVTINADDTAEEAAAKLASAINEISDQTGVIADVEGDKVSLVSTKEGKDLVLGGTESNGFETGTTDANAMFASDLDVSTFGDAQQAIKIVDAALTKVNSVRADMGAVQNRFESVIANLSTSSENLSASRSRIMDADFAKETANLTRGQILQQAGTAMLAQANSLPQNVLSLLG